MVGYVRFTGDYAKLKEMGYTFQKLYANNYMQWEKGGIRIWKKGSDITFDEGDLYTMLKFLEGNPVGNPVPAKMSDVLAGHKDVELCGYSYYVIYRTNKGIDGYDWGEYTKENHDKWKTFYEEIRAGRNPPYMGTRLVNNETLAIIQELKDLGWLEMVDEDQDWIDS